MLELISHVVQISSRRDRTEINSAMVESLRNLFQPERMTIYRCYNGNKKAMLFACAGIDSHGVFLRNAYLPEPHYCQPVGQDPLLDRCRQNMTAELETRADGTHRIVFPVVRLDEPIYLIDLLLPAGITAERRVVLMGLIEYFGNHIALLDYGEADTLTGLASRKTFDKHLFELLGKAASDDATGNPLESRRHSQPGATHWLAVCDIDHFKSVNDNFGHLIGDEVLILMAQAMRQSFRFDDQLFRFGGEEFIVLLQPTEAQFAFETLERFRRDVASQQFSRVGHVTVSIGFSALLPNDTPTDVIDRADEALYYAKRHGRNRVECYEQLVASGKVAPKDIAKGDVELF